MLEGAEAHARKVLLEKHQSLPPTWTLFDKNDHETRFATPWNDNFQKKLAEFFLRMQIVRYESVAYSFVTEAWLALTNSPDYKPNQPAGEQSERQEVVVALAVNRESQELRTWIIKRDYHERVIKLELKHIKDADTSFTSWMSSLFKPWEF